MGDLRDFSEFADPLLRLPIKGKVYEIPEPSIEVGLEVSGVFRGTNTDLDSKRPEYLWQRALGSAWDHLVADNVGYPALARAGFVAMIDIEYGRAAALKAWDEGSNPEAEAAQAAANRGPETQPTTQPDEGSTTPSPGSGPGTNAQPEPIPTMISDQLTPGQTSSPNGS
jgi:hypothetical protein